MRSEDVTQIHSPIMRRTRRLHLRIPLGRTAVTCGASWLVVAPAALWAVKTVYVAILGAFLDVGQAWAVTALIALLAALSILAHVSAHIAAAERTDAEAAPDIPLYLLADAAQIWPVSSRPGREAIAALAGPLASAVLAVIAFLLWNAQLHPWLNVAMPLVGAFNLALAVLNLAPAFPFDGGRLARGLGWRLLDRPATMTLVAYVLGFVLGAALAAWAVVLYAQRARFSRETALAALAWAVLILLPLVVRKPAGGVRSPKLAALSTREAWSRPLRFMPLRILVLALAMLALLALPASLVPFNDGLEAPGVAVPTAPMVEVPPERLHSSSGSFILTTVLQQAPIVAAEWLAGQVSPRFVRITPPEQIVPRDTTLQEQARQGYQMLDESEATAVVVGLRLAGYDAQAAGKGALIQSVLPESLSHNLLRPGDIIVGFDGRRVQTTSDLTAALAAKADAAAGAESMQAVLRLRRAGETLDVTVPLMPPSRSGGPPRIGITLAPAGFDYTLPFPVRIVPQKIVGGPSAGLMFALTVYDLLTPGDLTGGKKIAGTGTISLDGTVGPIGGVDRKVVAAELAGAEYFLSPPENYADALAAARRIKVVRVATAEEAIAFLRGL